MSLQCLSTVNMVFSDEDKILIKKFVFELVHSKEVDKGMSWLKKAGQRAVLISCWESCGTQAPLTGGQALADRAVKRNSYAFICLPPPPQPFYGPFSGTTRVSRCQKLDFMVQGKINRGRHFICLIFQIFCQHINTLSIHSYMHRGIKMVKKCICVHFLPYLLNICRKFEFLVSKGSVATCLRWDG